MAIDPRRLKPVEMCRLLNSTPLGEVIGENVLKRHRSKAGHKIGDNKHVDLLRYTGWLVQMRHSPKATSHPPNGTSLISVNLSEAALGAAEIGSLWEKTADSRQKLTPKQVNLIAALLTQPTYRIAAQTAGVSETTLYRWMRNPEFRHAYQEARRELVDTSMGRIQAASGQAVETLLYLARHAKRESDRLRAAMALIDRSLLGLHDADLLHGRKESTALSRMTTSDLVELLSARIQQVNTSELSTAEKARLTQGLGDALLRALGVDVLEKRLEALHAVLSDRKEKDRDKKK